MPSSNKEMRSRLFEERKKLVADLDPEFEQKSKTEQDNAVHTFYADIEERRKAYIYSKQVNEVMISSEAQDSKHNAWNRDFFAQEQLRIQAVLPDRRLGSMALLQAMLASDTSPQYSASIISAIDSCTSAIETLQFHATDMPTLPARLENFHCPLRAHFSCEQNFTHRRFAYRHLEKDHGMNPNVIRFCPACRIDLPLGTVLADHLETRHET